MNLVFVLFAAVLVSDSASGGPPDARVKGVVRDASGAPVAGATVTVKVDASPDAHVVTARDGSFAFEAAAPSVSIEVAASGFAPETHEWTAAGGALEVTLRRSRDETVTVTAARTGSRLGDTAARVIVIDSGDLAASTGPTLDDALRQVPGFSLFRRSDSRVANPTSQGASLRGVGASGASRTLVLLDGVPLNDPFGGWVYWSREPRAAVDRIEVVEGGASDLYGSAALGGVIQAIERTAAPALVGEASAGALGTGELSAYASRAAGAWTLRGSGEAFTTDGYVLVPDDLRGPVDTPAGGSHISGSLVASRKVSSGGDVFVRASAFGESRQNGTPLQVNDTDWQDVRSGGDFSWPGAGSLSVRAWYASQTYHQTFTATAADRSSEALTRRQRVPSQAAGVGVQWSRALGSRNALVAGLDGRWVKGRSDETIVTGGQPTGSVTAGGTDRTLAAFATDRLSLGTRTLLTLGARLDRWDGGASGATALSPRASALFRVRPRLALTAAAYGAFRSPTLNELYRSFRVGNTLTLANPDLTVERLAGAEAGAVWKGSDGRLRVRAVGFASRIDDPVANVTVRATPALVTRERQNLGKTRSRGVEADAEAQIAPRLWVRAGYALIDAVVVSFPANTALEGNRVPQVARHQGTFLIRYAQPRILDLSLEGRASSEQFEDDQNQLPLRGYFTLGATASRRFGRATAFVWGENLTGTRYAVGATPTPTIGPPRSVRFGVRFE